MRRKRDFIWDTGWTMTLFSRLVHEVSGKFPTAPESAGETSEPAIDIFQDIHDIVIEIEVPGVGRDDLSVRIDDDRLSIEGFKRVERDVGCLSYLCLERQFGAFRRVVQIPISVDTSSVNAVLDGGVLKIRLPKVPNRRRSIIEVPIADSSIPSREGDQ